MVVVKTISILNCNIEISGISVALVFYVSIIGFVKEGFYML